MTTTGRHVQLLRNELSIVLSQLPEFSTLSSGPSYIASAQTPVSILHGEYTHLKIIIYRVL